jgi:type I restriction enzyme S subunit
MIDWPSVPLSDLVRKSDETVELSASKVYREVTVRLWGKGIVERGTRTGAEIAGDRRFVVRPGQLLLSRIDARNGALGIVPNNLDGAVVSNDFPSFELDRGKIDPQFLGWMVRTQAFVDVCKRASEGTTNRVRLQQDKFLAATITLPPIEEQKRIAARIDNVATRLATASRLQSDAAAEGEALWPAILSSRLTPKAKRLKQARCNEPAQELLLTSAKRNRDMSGAKHNNAHPNAPKVVSDGPALLPDNWVWTTLGSILTHLVDCVNDTPDFSDVNTGLVGLKSTNIRPYHLDLKESWYMTPEDFERWNRRVAPQAGDVVLTREAPVGYACMLPQGQPFCLTQRLMLLRPDPLVVHPELLLHYLNSPVFLKQVVSKSRGLTTPHIRVQDAPEFLFPLPPRNDQDTIVAELRELRTSVTELWKTQALRRQELSAFLPAILARELPA